ncbi:MAG: hypothetical protein APZ16_06275 [Candidatus Hadarchaeum yellowstonense]|uniref:Uncharacterized protein n=1 Tax=Hadarchaeum yellowstonense TaxID=1776334 RepID=A0A147JZA0_HADYE|nr:MAG: hypothetical protein APZ16_06275 [Candidatus Hadarchaeum yellowstonense]
MAEKEKRLPLLLYAAILIVVGAAVLFAFLAVVLGIQPPEIPSVQFPGGSQPGENQSAENTAENAPPPVWPEKGGEFVPPRITPPPESLPAVGENEVLIRWFVAIGIRSTSWGGPIERIAENDPFYNVPTFEIPLPTYYDPNFRIGFNVKRRPLIPENVVINIYYENKIEFKNFVIKPENKIYSVEGELISKESARILNAGEVVALWGDRKNPPIIEISKHEVEDFFYTLDVQVDRTKFLFYLSDLYPREILTIEGYAKLSPEEAEKILSDLTLKTSVLITGEEISSVGMSIENKGTFGFSLYAVIEKYSNSDFITVERWFAEGENYITGNIGPLMYRQP